MVYCYKYVCIIFSVTSCSMMHEDDMKSTSEVIFSALTAIIRLCQNIVNAKICMNDLEKCSKSIQQLRALCNAANLGNRSLCQSFDDVSSAIGVCYKKFEYVEECSKKMEVLVKHCNKVSEGTQVYVVYFVFLFYTYQYSH